MASDPTVEIGSAQDVPCVCGHARAQHGSAMGAAVARALCSECPCTGYAQAVEASWTLGPSTAQRERRRVLSELPADEAPLTVEQVAADLRRATERALALLEELRDG